MKRLFARTVGSEICGALGLDPLRVKSLTLDFQPDEVVISVVRLYVTEDQIDPISQVLRKYTLVPKGDD